MGAEVVWEIGADSKLDLDAVIDNVLGLSQLSLELQRVVERVTIDPLLVFQEGSGVKDVGCSVGTH